MSFSNETRIEAGLETVTGESRERIADTVPGKYQLTASDDRNGLHYHFCFSLPSQFSFYQFVT